MQPKRKTKIMPQNKNPTEVKFEPAQAVPVAAFVDYHSGSIVSREILKGAAGKVTLFAFDEGEGLSEHTSPLNALVQIVEGEAQVAVSGQPRRVKAGELHKTPRLERLRRRAQAPLKPSAQAVLDSPDREAPILIHEMRLRLKELEMKNEELRRVQLDLESSRDRFARLYDLSPVGYLTLDADGVVCEANLTAARLLGLDRQVLLRKKMLRFIAPESQTGFCLHRRQFFSGASRQCSELQMRRLDGTAFTGRLESMKETAAGGRPARCLVALSDVTERHRADAERSRLAAIVDSSEDAIVSRALNDVVITWNAGAEQLFGYFQSEIVGRSFSVLVPLDRRDEARQIRQRIMQGQLVTHYETIRIAKDGRRIAVSLASSPVKDAAGKIVGISAILRDVSVRKQIEETLRQSEATLASFFAESPLGLLWVAEDGRILRVNRAQLEMLGRAGEEISGRSICEFHADPAFATAALERLAKKETLRDHHGRLRHKNGMIRHVLIDANGLWEQGRLVHSRWFVRDITTRVELQTELLQIVERERQRIGHDLHDGLGQHLHGISYLAALLEKGLREEASPRAREAGQLNKHLNHALELTRSLAHGFQPINPVPEGLMLALRELAKRIGGLYRADCRFECRFPVLIHRHSASTHLYRIAQEAVSNAIKHGKATRIQIHLAATPQRIVLGVRDNGVGIRRRAKRSKGMGLHIMQYRAGAIGGSMVVRKLPRRGTEVVCTVPRQALLLHDKGIK